MGIRLLITFFNLKNYYVLTASAETEYHCRWYIFLGNVHNWSEFSTLHRRSLGHSDYFTHVRLTAEEPSANSVHYRKKKIKPHYSLVYLVLLCQSTHKAELRYFKQHYIYSHCCI